MAVDMIHLETEEKMEKAVDYIKAEFRGIRTGRASTALVEHIKVEYYGSSTPMKQLANISTPESNLIVIKPFDASCIKDIDKAIQTANIGLTPNNDGRLIRLNVPPLSGERRQQLIQQVKQLAEQGRVQIRSIRRDANKQLDQEEKAKEITEDDRDKGKEDIDELTKSYIETIDKLLEGKSEEIMEV